MLAVTDPAEIASIERGMSEDCKLTDIIGGKDVSGFWAYQFSVERFRKRVTASQRE